MSVHIGQYKPVSYHDCSNYNSTILHARSVVWKQRRVLDQHQFVRVIPVANLQEKQEVRSSAKVCIHSY